MRIGMGMDDRRILDFNRRLAGEIYLAVSDGLTAWAEANDRLYLFKIGSSKDARQRLDDLNGDPWRGRASQPCLGFRDWRLLGTWWIYDDESRIGIEGYIRRRFAKFLDYLDFRQVHGTTHAGNGETEIFRLKLELLPALPGMFETYKLKGMVGRMATDMIDLLVEDIHRRS